MPRVILFLKRPRAGHVKTRLARSIGDEAALALYRSFVTDQIAFVSRVADLAEVELCVDQPWPVVERAARGGPTCRLQGDGDLGCRMRRAVERTARDGALPVVIVAGDAPTLPESHLRAALRRLDGHAQVVIDPSDDGGYVLLGLDRPYEAPFEEVPWGGPHVAARTRERIAAAGLRLVELSGWYDVDQLADLARLRRDLRGDSRRRAPATSATLDDLDRAGLIMV